MSRTWEKEQFPYVQSYPDPNRPKYGRKFDRYYRARFKVAGKLHIVTFGWMSEGWTARSVYDRACLYKSNVKVGKRPTSWKEEQALSKEQARKDREKDITFNDYWKNHYYPDAKVSKKESTYIPEERHFRQWLSPSFGNKPIHQITSDNLTDLRNLLLNQGKAPRTVQYVFSTFRLIWNHAKRRGVVQGDCPTRAVSLGRINNERVRFLSTGEVQELLAELRKENIDAHDFAVMALNTGGRRGELMQLKWEDIDLKDDEIRILHTKTGEPRTIPVVPELKKVLVRRKEAKTSGFVFCHEDGQPWKDVPYALRRVIRELFNQGVEDNRHKVCVHSLRHTAASHMLRSGVDVRTIQSLFGWSTLQMLQRYTHVMDESKQRALKSLSGSYNKQEDNGKIIPFKTGTGEEGGE